MFGWKVLVQSSIQKLDSKVDKIRTYAGDFREANNFAIGEVANMNFAKKGDEMMLAQTVYLHGFQ